MSAVTDYQFQFRILLKLTKTLIKMFKFFALCFLAIFAVAAAKPGLVAYSSPLVASPYTAAYTAAYSSPYVASPYVASPYVASPYAAYSAYSAYPYAAAPVLVR